MPKLIKEVCGTVISGVLVVWVVAMLLTNEPCERLARFDWLPAAAVGSTVFVVEPFVSKATAAGISDSLNVVRAGVNGIFAKIVLRKAPEDLACQAKVRGSDPAGSVKGGGSADAPAEGRSITELDEARELLKALQDDVAPSHPESK